MSLVLGQDYVEVYSGTERLLYTTRAYGNMSNEIGNDTAGADMRRQKLWAHLGGRSIQRLVCTGSSSAFDFSGNVPDVTNRGDAAIINLSRHAAVILPADCPVVGITSPKSELGLFVHISTLTLPNGLLGRSVVELCQRTRLEPSEFSALVGPYIDSEDYRWTFTSNEQRDEVFGPEWDGFITRTEHGAIVDIGARTLHQLELVGIDPAQVTTSDLHTTTRTEPGGEPMFFSNSFAARGLAEKGLNAAVFYREIT